MPLDFASSRRTATDNDSFIFAIFTSSSVNSLNQTRLQKCEEYRGRKVSDVFFPY